MARLEEKAGLEGPAATRRELQSPQLDEKDTEEKIDLSCHQSPIPRIVGGLFPNKRIDDDKSRQARLKTRQGAGSARKNHNEPPR